MSVSWFVQWPLRLRRRSGDLVSGLGEWDVSGSRAQSSVIGVVLVFAIVVAGSTLTIALGADAFASTSDRLHSDRAEQSMTQLDSQISLVGLGSSDLQQVELSGSTGDYAVENGSGTMTVSYTNRTTGVETVIVPEANMGAVVYRNGETAIAYQGGGVWRRSEGGGTTMVSPPEFHYREATLTLPLVSVSGDPSLDNSATISGNESTQYYPNESRDFGNPLENGRVNVTVQSDYYRAWGAYFTERTDGSVSYDHDDDEVTITLVIPAENDPVTAGIVSAGAGTTLTISNNAEADSYNSSEAPYGTFPDGSETRIVTAGDVVVDNNAVLHGSLEAGGGVSIDNNGEIKGNLSYGDSVGGKGGAAQVDGWVAQNASVDAPDPVNGLIGARGDAFDDRNNNSDPDSDIDESTNQLECSSDCEIVAGSYYLDSMDVTSGDLELDTTDGPIDIYVDGDIRNDQNIDVVGNGRVNIYLNGSFTYNNGAATSVPGDKAPNFWVYMRQDETATFVNNAEFTGVVYGPGTASDPGVEFGLSNNAEVWGGLVGDADSIDNNFVVHYDEALTQTTSVQRDRTLPALTYMHVSVNRVNVSSR